MNTNKAKLTIFALACTLGFGMAACGQKQTAAAEGQQTTDVGNTVVSDAATTAKIKAAILTEPNLKSFQIAVTTRDGVVNLTGTVDTQASRDKAQQLVETFSGVKFVENQLVVSPS